MTTRQEIDRIISEYSGVPRDELPEFLRSPDGEHEFNLGIALATAGTDGVEPIYENDVMVGWKGVALKRDAG